MRNNSPNNKSSQKAKGGKNVTMVGRDYTSTTSVNLLFPIFLIGVLTLGGIAWAINTGLLKDSGSPQQTSPQPGATSTK